MIEVKGSHFIENIPIYVCKESEFVWQKDKCYIARLKNEN